MKRCSPKRYKHYEGEKGKPRITQFVRDGWAKPWPVGPEMLCYMLAHEAHYRGQVAMLATTRPPVLERCHIRYVELGKTLEAEVVRTQLRLTGFESAQ